MTRFGTIERDVLFGRDGELFLASGGHHVLDYATRRRPVNTDVVDVFCQNIISRASYAKKISSQYLHVVFPDKQSVLTEKFLIPDPFRLGEHYLRSLEGSNAPTLYPLDILLSAKMAPFLHTDTHLSDIGTILIASRVAELLSGVDLTVELGRLAEMLTVRRKHRGDLGSKLDPPHEAEETFGKIDWEISYFHNEIPGGSNGGVDIYFAKSPRFKKRLLWFGDSFGRETVKFLSYFFAEILFLRTPFFHPEFADQMRPDFIVSDNVERYLASCTSDEHRPSFNMYPFMSDRAYTAGRPFAEAFSAILSYPRSPYKHFVEQLSFKGTTSRN